MATVRKDGKLYLCVHSDCVDRFKDTLIFGVKGSDYRILPVRDTTEAKQHGATGMIDSCVYEGKEPTCQTAFPKSG